MSTQTQKKGDGERIKIDRSRPWGSVPQAMIEDRRLSPTARLVAIWFCIRPPGWTVRRAHLLASLGIGLHAWWGARRELIQHKYLIAAQCRSGGRFGTADLEFFPQPELATALGFTERGGPELGSPGLGKPEPLPVTGLPVTVKTKQQQKNVVVVFEKEEEETVVQWPASLAKELIPVCAKSIIESNRPQALADELAGAMTKKPIGNPAAWLRSLVKLDQAGTLVLEHAASVLAAREARAAAADRERLAFLQPPKKTAAAAQPASKAARDAARDKALADYKNNLAA